MNPRTPTTPRLLARIELLEGAIDLQALREGLMLTVIQDIQAALREEAPRWKIRQIIEEWDAITSETDPGTRRCTTTPPNRAVDGPQVREEQLRALREGPWVG